MSTPRVGTPSQLPAAHSLAAHGLAACRRLPLSLVAVAVLLGAPSLAKDVGSEIDDLFHWATAETPGCAVGVSHHGKVVANLAYGLADLEHQVPIGPGTVFDIGSVQKQFVAAAVLLLVQDGSLALTDDIRRHVPELADTGHTITLDHLLTHTSGLRDWGAPANFSGTRRTR